MLDDLPFDLILGHSTCRRWKGVLDWGKANFAITPGEQASRIEIDWNVYKGEHWRKPVMFTAREDTVIQENKKLLASYIRKKIQQDCRAEQE